VRTGAEESQLTVNADIQTKLLKGNLAQRRMLLSSLPRLSLTLYELSSANDGQGVDQRAERLRKASHKFLTMVYEGLGEPNLATINIALRTPDYGSTLSYMLETLDEANHSELRYRGLAWHSYSDDLKPAY
jgi:hypothetical protein